MVCLSDQLFFYTQNYTFQSELNFLEFFTLALDWETIESVIEINIKNISYILNS